MFINISLLFGSAMANGDLIDLNEYRRRRQRELNGKSLKERVLKFGSVVLLGGLVGGATLLAGYGAYRLFSSEPTPREVYREVNRSDQPLPIERVFLPRKEEIVEYLPDNGLEEGVLVKKGGFIITYLDTNKDHAVDRIIIDDTTTHGSSSLEKKVLIPFGFSDFIYGTELLRKERDAQR